MTLERISGIGGASISPPLQTVRSDFSETMARTVLPTHPVPTVSVLPARPPVEAARVQAGHAIDQVHAAQQRLDQVMQMAQSGRSFTSAELLAMQARVFQASQQLDLAGKVVEKATSGVKQILQTQV